VKTSPQSTVVKRLAISLLCLMTGLPGVFSQDTEALTSESGSTQSSGEGQNLGEFFDGFAVGGNIGYGLFHGSLADYDVFAPMDDFNTYYRFAWRIFAQREIKWGLTAKLAFERGTLGGGRTPGVHSLPVDFESEYNTINLMASYDLLNELFGKDEDVLKKSKFYLNAEIGIGMSLFRSYTIWRPENGQQGEIRDYTGYNVVDDSPPTQRYLLDGKDSPAVTFNVPVGFTFGYRLNYKTDVTFSYMLNNLSTDRLDSWDRDFSANDKYSFFGVGLTYNFNRSPEDYPPKKVKEPKEEKEDKWRLFGSKKEDVEPNAVNMAMPLESKQANKIDPATQNKDLEEVRMKMFELQLKLFEMQYLLNGGKNPQTPGTPAPAPSK
jgi:hypothetical protein